jgi:hypothetical protein
VKTLHSLAFLALYVDPGSGSMMLQLLLGGVSGIYVIFRIFKQKILGLFGIHAEQPEAADQLQFEAVSKDDQRRRQP